VLTVRQPTNKALNIVVVVVTIIIALLVANIFMGLILVSNATSPFAAVQNFIEGAISSDATRASVIMIALPMLLCASGLLLTFTAGLWNIGIEGQVTMGAVFATIIARSVTADSSPAVALPAELVLSMIGGALWAALAALLKIYGNVNEIFGGVALNFIAQNVLIYLVTGPWRVGTYPQTAAFEAPALLPQLSPGQVLSLPAIVLAIVGFVIVFVIMNGTRWGLELKAMGRSERSAFLLGVRTRRNTLLSMMFCGALAGLAGAFLVLSPISRTRLVSGVSGGIGFLGVLIVLLVNFQPLWVPLITLFFAFVPIGTLKLQSTMGLDSSLGNVYQSAIVLALLLRNGILAGIARLTAARSIAPTLSPTPEKEA